MYKGLRRIYRLRFNDVRSATIGCMPVCLYAYLYICLSASLSLHLNTDHIHSEHTMAYIERCAAYDSNKWLRHIYSRQTTRDGEQFQSDAVKT